MLNYSPHTVMSMTDGVILLQFTENDASATPLLGNRKRPGQATGGATAKPVRKAEPATIRPRRPSSPSATKEPTVTEEAVRRRRQKSYSTVDSDVINARPSNGLADAMGKEKIQQCARSSQPNCSDKGQTTLEELNVRLLAAAKLPGDLTLTTTTTTRVNASASGPSGGVSRRSPGTQIFSLDVADKLSSPHTWPKRTWPRACEDQIPFPGDCLLTHDFTLNNQSDESSNIRRPMARCCQIVDKDAEWLCFRCDKH